MDFLTTIFLSNSAKKASKKTIFKEEPPIVQRQRSSSEKDLCLSKEYIFRVTGILQIHL